MPWVLVLDSLGGPRSTVQNNLKKFLVSEAKERRDVDCDVKWIKSGAPKVPQQPNSYDCGVFLLHYVETFCKDTHLSYLKLQEGTAVRWFPQREIENKRRQIVDLIQDLRFEYDEYKKTLPQTMVDDTGTMSSSENDDDECFEAVEPLKNVIREINTGDITVAVDASLVDSDKTDDFDLQRGIVESM